MRSSGEEAEQKREAYEFGMMMRRRHDMKDKMAEFDLCEETINRLADGKMTGDPKAVEAIDILTRRKLESLKPQIAVRGTRLNPGVTEEQYQSELSALIRRMMAFRHEPEPVKCVPCYSSSSEDVEKDSWWQKYGCLTPEEVEEYLREDTITNLETKPGMVFVKLDRCNPLVDAIRVYAKMPGKSGWGLCHMYMRDLDSILAKLIEEFRQNVPEEMRLKNMEAHRNAYREEQMQEYVELETKYLYIQEELARIPPANKVPLDSLWGGYIGVNVEMLKLPEETILNRDTYEEDGYFSVDEYILDKIVRSVYSSIQDIEERLEELKLEQEQLV